MQWPEDVLPGSVSVFIDNERDAQNRVMAVSFDFPAVKVC
jgi:hypothetical protein